MYAYRNKFHLFFYELIYKYTIFILYFLLFIFLAQYFMHYNFSINKSLIACIIKLAWNLFFNACYRYNCVCLICTFSFDITHPVKPLSLNPINNQRIKPNSRHTFNPFHTDLSQYRRKDLLWLQLHHKN